MRLTKQGRTFEPGARLSDTSYRRFLELIFNHRISIRNACKVIRISYSSGKYIIKRVREDWKTDSYTPRGGFKEDFRYPDSRWRKFYKKVEQ